VRSLWQALRSGEADVVLLHEIPAGWPLQRLARTVPPLACRDRRPDVNLRWRISLPESPEAELPLSPHTRKHLRYYSNRLARKYGAQLRIETFTDVSDLERLMRDAEAVAATTYQRRLGVGFAADARTRERIRYEMTHGWFRSWVLYVGGAPRAFWIGLRYGDTYHSGETGYDPNFRSDRLGEFLLSVALEALRREPGLRRFDFGFGDADYKRRYSSDHLEEATIAIFAPTPRGVLLNAARGLVGGLNRALKTAVARLDLLDPLRSRARRRLVRADARPATTPGIPWSPLGVEGSIGPQDDVR
ncbi:MAG: GNAT family N-acetyltransferase, partial [Candidatus Binatia bacterium]